MDDLLTINNVAKRLRVQAIDVRRLLQDKKLSAIETDVGEWRISAKALKEYVDRVARRERGSDGGKLGI